MSRFLRPGLSGFVSYTPGEQPRDMKYIKLNTNESPYPPAQSVIDAAAAEAGKCNLYNDPRCTALCQAAAETFGVTPDMVLPVNGSDEILNFVFMTFFAGTEVMYPAITYGVYPVLASLYGVKAIEVPMAEGFAVDPEDYIGANRNIVIANPNAPTGLTLTPMEIEAIVASNPNNIVVIDEAYVEFGAESVVGLTRRYDNLIVTRTFSKSHSLAGARLGFGIADAKLIADMELVKYATNPYNVNRMTQAAGVAAFKENGLYLDNCKRVAETREYTADKLRKLGFTMTESRANFLFAKHDNISGKELNLELRKRGILVRHFGAPVITDYNRITIGARGDMDALVDAAKDILDHRRNGNDA